ncbi:MAG TPA: acetyltransferase [Phycisphaerae bacterium]|nr:acetyltransferase [Phycisphaerae bacterium]
MKRLLIVGAGGFGREVAGYAMDVPAAARDWELGGFLNSDPRALDGFECDYPILGDPLTFSLAENDVVVCAIGDPVGRLRLCRALQQRGARFISLIHPMAGIARHTQIGEGCIVCPRSGVSTNVRLGSFVVVNGYTTIGHDAVLGDGCTLSSHCDVTGGAVLGEGVFLGSHACVLPRARVGDYAVVGAGSVVLRRVRPHTSVMGVPARAIESRQAGRRRGSVPAI